MVIRWILWATGRMDLSYTHTEKTMIRADLEKKKDPSYKVTGGKATYIDNG